MIWPASPATTAALAESASEGVFADSKLEGEAGKRGGGGGGGSVLIAASPGVVTSLATSGFVNGEDVDEDGGGGGGGGGVGLEVDASLMGETHPRKLLRHVLL